MKKYLLFVCALIVALVAGAATTSQDVTLWEGEQVCGDTWSEGGYQRITYSSMTNVAAGDQIIVNVSAISSNCQYPQVYLQRYDWANFSTVAQSEYAISVKGKETPYAVTYNVSADMLAEIVASGGITVKGVGYTFTSVVLRHYFEVGDSESKGNAATTLWEGSEVISWSGDYKYSQKIDAGKFADAKAGNVLRMYYTATGITTQGSLCYGNYGSISGFKVTTPLTGNYYEYTLTEESAAGMNANGLRVNGIGFTLTKVELVDTDKEYILSSEIDRSQICVWDAGTTPKLTATIKNHESIELTVPYTVNIYNDMVDEDTETRSLVKQYANELTIAAGETKSATLVFPEIAIPGFYRIIASVNGKDIASYYIGYNPTALDNKRDAQPDFWTYWDDAKAQLATIAPEYSLEEMTAYSTANRKVYKVSMKSVPDAPGEDAVTIMGYYAEPVGEGKYPVIIRFQGTDGGTSTLPNPMNGDDLIGWGEFVLSTRGQMLCRDDKYGYDFYSYGWGDKELHYYRNAYLDCVRAVDFIKSRATTKQDEIFGVGGSQGGCFTYVAAALTGAFRAIAPSITGHADFVSGMRIVNWPRAKFLAAQKNLGMTNEERDAFNSYYDTMNFSEAITCAVITNFSLQDVTDPARTNIAPYNLLVNVPADQKEWSINPFLGHATPSEWYNTYMNFFRKYVGTTATQEVSCTAVQDDVNQEEYYATYSNNTCDVELKAADGATLTVYDVTVSNSTLNLNPRTGTKVACGEAVLVKTSNSTFTASLLNECKLTPASYGTETLLRATPNGALTVGCNASDYNLYRLTYDNGTTGLGFYWGNAEGSQIKAKPGKGYLKVPADGASQIQGFRFNPQPTYVEGINVEEQQSNEPIYDLSGRRVENPSTGIYIHGNKKYLVK